MNTNEKPSAETLKEWHSNPDNWKLGVFYYNKDDKRIFPPKRMMGMGWTVNFANPASYLSLLALLIVTYMIFKYLI